MYSCLRDRRDQHLGRRLRLLIEAATVEGCASLCVRCRSVEEACKRSQYKQQLRVALSWTRNRSLAGPRGASHGSRAGVSSRSEQVHGRPRGTLPGQPRVAPQLPPLGALQPRRQAAATVGGVADSTSDRRGYGPDDGAQAHDPRVVRQAHTARALPGRHWHAEPCRKGRAAASASAQGRYPEARRTSSSSGCHRRNGGCSSGCHRRNGSGSSGSHRRSGLGGSAGASPRRRHLGSHPSRRLAFPPRLRGVRRRRTRR